MEKKFRNLSSETLFFYRPNGLCAFCQPGDPCPTCVKDLGAEAWDLSIKWEERLADYLEDLKTLKEFQDLAVGQKFQILKNSKAVFMKLPECSHDGIIANCVCVESDQQRHAGHLSFMSTPHFTVWVVK